jgi:beta-lactam-binding protein with PASTA domain
MSEPQSSRPEPTPPTPTPDAPDAHAKRRAVGLWIFTAVAVVIVVVGALYFFAIRSARPDKPTVASSTATAPSATAPAKPLPAGTSATPNLLGTDAAAAESAVTAAGFVPLAAVIVTSTGAPGAVIAQVPDAGAPLVKGSQVALAVAQSTTPAGLQPIVVPTVYQLTKSEAQSLAMSVGFFPVFLTGPSQEAKGVAAAQWPTTSETATPWTPLIILMSDGTVPQPATIAIPDVVGSPEADAIAALKGVKLDSQIVSGFDKAPAGTVFRQIPPAGGQVAPGTPVALGVSLGLRPKGIVAVPDVTGLTPEAAIKSLTAAGLMVQQAQIADTLTPADKVVGQTPKAGWSVPVGSIAIVSVSATKVAP